MSISAEVRVFFCARQASVDVRRGTLVVVAEIIICGRGTILATLQEDFAAYKGSDPLRPLDDRALPQKGGPGKSVFFVSAVV